MSDKPNWNRLLADTVNALNHLKVAWETTERQNPEIHAALVEDIYLPCVRHLAEFCACVEIKDENDREDEG